MRFLQHFCVSVVMVSSLAMAKADTIGCVLDGVVLNCSGGKNPATDAEITNSFSSAQTREVLANPLEELGRFERKIEREYFRVSLEKHWETVRRHELKQRSLLKQRKMSSAEFEEWSSTYDDAVKSYEAGLDFYRALIWQTQD